LSSKYTPHIAIARKSVIICCGKNRNVVGNSMAESNVTFKKKK